MAFWVDMRLTISFQKQFSPVCLSLLRMAFAIQYESRPRIIRIQYFSPFPENKNIGLL